MRPKVKKFKEASLFNLLLARCQTWAFGWFCWWSWRSWLLWFKFLLPVVSVAVNDDDDKQWSFVQLDLMMMLMRSMIMILPSHCFSGGDNMHRTQIDLKPFPSIFSCRFHYHDNDDDVDDGIMMMLVKTLATYHISRTPGTSCLVHSDPENKILLVNCITRVIHSYHHNNRQHHHHHHHHWTKDKARTIEWIKTVYWIRSNSRTELNIIIGQIITWSFQDTHSI